MPIEEIIDLAIGPLIDLLTNVVAWLDQVSLVAAQGLRLERYLAYAAVAGPEWVELARTTALVLGLVGIVWVAKSGYQLYLRVKAGVKWW